MLNLVLSLTQYCFSIPAYRQAGNKIVDLRDTETTHETSSGHGSG
jgi:hypothetical protein